MMHQIVCACDEQHFTPADRDAYYVTVRDGGPVGFLLGPYDSHDAALANVDRGNRLAHEADARAHWYAFGTARVPANVRKPRTVFGR